MSISLVQSAESTGQSTAFGGGGGILNSSVNFGSTTGAGNFLVAIIYIKCPISSNINGISVATSGLTWVGTGVVQSGAGTPIEQTQIYYVQNAPSISNATSTTFSINYSSSGAVQVEGTLYEFSGILQSGNPVESHQSRTLQTNGVPVTNSVATSLSDLVIVSYAGDTGSVSPGTGYTAGPTVSVMQFGGSQYQLNTSGSPTPTAFSGTSQANWAATAVSFKPPISSGSAKFTFGQIIGV